MWPGAKWKKIIDTQETVVDEVIVDEKDDFIDVDPDSFKKIKELERNKSIALSLERDKNSELINKLKSFEDKELDSIEKDKLKKWKYEEVISELKESNTTLQEKAVMYDELIKDINDKKSSKIQSLKEVIPKELLEENELFLEDMSDDKKILFMERLVQKGKKEDFNNGANDSDDITKVDDLDKAKSEGDVMSILQNAKTI